MPYNALTGGLPGPGAPSRPGFDASYDRASWDTGRGTGTFGAAGSYTPPVFNYGSDSSAAQNLYNIDYLGDLTRSINSINLAAQKAANEARIPGAAGLEAKSSTNIAQELAGKVPRDVMDLLGQQAAERGVGTGSNVNASYLRALGLTSLGQEKSGQQDLTAAYARNPAAPLFDPSGQMVTPGQLTQQELERQQLELERQRLAAEVAGGYYTRGDGGVGRAVGSPRDSIAALSSPGTYALGSNVPDVFSVPEVGDPYSRWLASIGWPPASQSYAPATGALTPEEGAGGVYG